jgi:hypothetical protein
LLFFAGFFFFLLSRPRDVSTESAGGGRNGITFSISIIYTLEKTISITFFLNKSNFEKSYVKMSILDPKALKRKQNCCFGR